MRPKAQYRLLKAIAGFLQLMARQVDLTACGSRGATLLALLVAALPCQIGSETTSPTLSHGSEVVPDSRKQGVLAQMSNLRTSPSIHGEVLTVAKEGSRVTILRESGRWLQVRSEEGVEAWIYKPLVLIEPETRQSPLPTPVVEAPADVLETIPAAPDPQVVGVESPPQSSPQELLSETSPAAPIEALNREAQQAWIAWVRALWFDHLQGLAAYIIVALTVVLGLSIALQLRSSRQLRGAMQEVGYLLDIVEEIYASGVRPQRNDGSATGGAPTHVSPTRKSPPPGLEFSAVEHLVLQALAEQPEMQEEELAKFLAEKGFAGMLIKAVIGSLVRKTRTFGLPWVETRYVQGRFSYRLSSAAEPAPSRP